MSARLAVRVPVSTLWADPQAPREVDAPAVTDWPDVASWAAAMADETRLGLHGRTLSQLLLGEPVEVVDERDGWAQVVAPWQPSSADVRGYPGWVRRAHLDEPAEASLSTVVVRQRVTRLVLDEGPGVEGVSWGTVLPLLADDAAWARVALPGGATGRLPADAVALRQPGVPVAFDSERLLATAGRLRGLRYLWGGTCGHGLDCSGLVHLAFRVLGIVVPRDADDQQAAAIPVAPDSADRGDLYFFGTGGEGIDHVGLVTGPLRMLHATEGSGRVEEVPLDAERRRTRGAAGRFPATPPGPRQPFRPS